MLKDRSELVAQIQRKNIRQRELMQEIAAAKIRIEELENKLIKSEEPKAPPKRKYTKAKKATK
jgi:hypothetical protein